MRTRRRPGCLTSFLLLLVAIAFGPSLVGLTSALVKCRPWADVQPANPARDPSIQRAVQEIPDYARREDLTYLTLPEWYIVYSTDEYADFIAGSPPSQFPHFRAVAQYWQSYAEVCEVVQGQYPFNNEHQFALGFIGISFTAENMLKGVYEGTIGRLAEWTASEPTQEDLFAARVTREYGEFMHMTPWYFFPFRERLQELWTETSLWGPSPVRKWERKLALTAEYALKALYARLTGLGAEAAYGGADVEKIHAVTTGLSEDMLSNDLERIEELDGERQLIRITRFEYFSDVVPQLTARGLQFEEIAGNDDMLLTLIGPQAADYGFEHGAYLFDLPILTRPGQTRVAMHVRVADIGAFLEELQSQPDIQFEHMYDY